MDAKQPEKAARRRSGPPKTHSSATWMGQESRNNYSAEQRDQPFRVKHNKSQINDFCMSGICYFKNKDR